MGGPRDDLMQHLIHARPGDGRPIPMQRILAGVAIAILAAELAILLAGGVQVGGGNHSGLLPVVRRLLDPGYLPGDFGIELRLHHHAFFASVAAGLTRVLGEEAAFLILTHAGYIILMLGLWRLSLAVGLPLGGFALTAVILATGTAFVGRGWEINDFLGNGPVMPPVFAHGFVLFSLSALVRRNHVQTLAWTGAVLLLHVQIGVIWLCVLGLVALLAREWPNARALALGTLALLAIGAAGIHDLWNLLSEGVVAGDGDGLQYLRFRMPHHFELRGARHAAWLLAYTAVLVFWWRRTSRRGLPEARAARLLSAVGLALAVLSMLHALDWYLLGNGLIAQIQFVRLTPLIPVLGMLALVSMAARRLDGRLLTVLAVLIAAPALALAFRGTGTAELGVVREADRPGTWHDLLRWVREHGPRDGLYVTPPGQSGFTAMTDRSTVVDFKVNPDGARARDAWYERLRAIAGETLPDLGDRGDNAAALDRAYAARAASILSDLACRYGVRYAVLPVEVEANGDELYRNRAWRLIAVPPAMCPGPSAGSRQQVAQPPH